MSAETLEAIGERHNLHAEEISPLKDVGIFNSIYLVGSEYVLRVPRVAPPFVAAIRKESVAVPAARAAGVRTPALVVLDDSLVDPTGALCDLRAGAWRDAWYA
jgi:hypothetical protein